MEDPGAGHWGCWAQPEAKSPRGLGGCLCWWVAWCPGALGLETDWVDGQYLTACILPFRPSALLLPLHKKLTGPPLNALLALPDTPLLLTLSNPRSHTLLYNPNGLLFSSCLARTRFANADSVQLPPTHPSRRRSSKRTTNKPTTNKRRDKPSTKQTPASQ
jgi:hypothetical protein